ncbi:hypothetical protein Cgig2_007732 [Carnegiea gigantea]|uniref:DNA/RNA-binding protein Alba-like domain-containing protein n=1 Tax=Carnegiea gigantea TaxID=171969 RepID=A0A9Q1K9P0_9CARY|nr:hypothetical protein Cgig2_007732 [Carnegiea gigantea]
MVAETEAVVAAEPHMVVVQVAPTAAEKADEPQNNQKKNRIQVSNTKKPLFFYLNLAKRYIKQHNEVELTALGMAIPTAVTIAEILKANGTAVEKRLILDMRSMHKLGEKAEGVPIRSSVHLCILKLCSRRMKNAANQKTTPGTAKVENEKTPAETAKTEKRKTPAQTAEAESKPIQ